VNKSLTKFKNINELKHFRKKLNASSDKEQNYIMICGGTGCHSSGTNKVINTALISN